MAAQVLHVTNQGQSVRMRIRQGMRGRSLGRPSIFSLQPQLSTRMSKACRVAPRCQPWRWQRVAQGLPTTMGKHNPPPRSLQHQLSTGMPRACQLTPSWQP